jgi:hypothetical protein
MVLGWGQDVGMYLQQYWPVFEMEKPLMLTEKKRHHC